MFCRQCGAVNADDVAVCVRCGASMQPPVARFAPETVEELSYAPVVDYRYAGFWIRFVAWIVDQIILGIPVFILTFSMVIIATVMGSGEEAAELISNCCGNLFSLVAYWIYAALMESSSRQATLGKMVCGLVVVDEQRQRITFGRATARHFAKILSALILLIGFIMAAFTERKQGLHDLICRTLVIYKPRS